MPRVVAKITDDCGSIYRSANDLIKKVNELRNVNDKNRERLIKISELLTAYEQYKRLVHDFRTSG